MDKKKLEKGVQLAKDAGAVLSTDMSASQSDESPERQAVDTIEGKAKQVGSIAAREGKKAIEKLIKDKLNAPPGAQPLVGEEAPPDTPKATAEDTPQAVAEPEVEPELDIEPAPQEKPRYVTEFAENTVNTATDTPIVTKETTSPELDKFEHDVRLDTKNTSPAVEMQDNTLEVTTDTAEALDTTDNIDFFATSSPLPTDSNLPSSGSEVKVVDDYVDIYTPPQETGELQPDFEDEPQAPTRSYIQPYEINEVSTADTAPKIKETKTKTGSGSKPLSKKEDWQLDTIETDSSLSSHNADGVALQTSDGTTAALSTADGAGLTAGNTAVQTADMAVQAGEAVAETGEVVAETSAEAAGAAATAGVTVAASAAKKVAEKIKNSVVEATKQVKDDGKKGLGALASFLLIPIFFMAVITCTAGFTGLGTASNTGLSDDVIALMPKIQAACEKYNISEYAPLVAAVMMQESGGNIELVHGDVMQCAESMGYPAGTAVDVDESIDHGTGLIANLLTQVGCAGVTDINGISLALQSYNFGPGFISWAQARGGYSKENAEAFAAYMAAQMGWSGYGDSEYVDHVLRYYSTTGITGELGPDSLLANGAFAYPCAEAPWITYDNHEGIDIQVARGTPVYACASGIVNYTQTGYTEGVFYDSGSLATYGNCVFISHDDDWETRYAHLSVVTVSSGSYVQKGQLIGYSGNTGNSYGAHLHLALYYKGSPGAGGIIYAAQAWPQLHQ